MEDNKNKAWVMAVDMGYGHQRTAYPLKDLSANGIINANNYPGIPEKDRVVWKSSREFYEFISNTKKIPLVGNLIFSLYDKFQRIRSYYPKRNLSSPNISLKETFSLIEKGWGENLIKTLSANPLPILTTFFVPAFMAEQFNYPGDIYCVICDADIARPWVPLNPKKSRIKYFAPCKWAEDRLKLYGIKEENIFLTGYPLPKENVGEGTEIVRRDLAYRLLNLDTKKEYFRNYYPVIKNFLGELPEKPDHPLTIMFSVGGAGAQKEIGVIALKSLRKKIKAGEMKMIFSVGIKKEINDYVLEQIKELGLENEIGKNIEIVFCQDINNYFSQFNQKLRKTDILWTKPSELSFYSGLGIPIIIAPTIGSQEDFNRRWILHINSGFLQDNPKYTDQWLFDMLDGGSFAEAAMEGFIEIEKMGTYNIERIINQSKINQGK